MSDTNEIGNVEWIEQELTSKNSYLEKIEGQLFQARSERKSYENALNLIIQGEIDEEWEAWIFNESHKISLVDSKIWRLNNEKELILIRIKELNKMRSEKNIKSRDGIIETQNLLKKSVQDAEKEFEKAKRKLDTALAKSEEYNSSLWELNTSINIEKVNQKTQKKHTWSQTSWKTKDLKENLGIKSEIWTEIIDYRVKNWDTLGDIAWKFKTTATEIKNQNQV